MNEKDYEIVMKKLADEAKFNMDFMYKKAGKDYVYTYVTVTKTLIDIMGHFAQFNRPKSEEENS